jgi:hypothetical protein
MNNYRKILKIRDLYLVYSLSYFSYTNTTRLIVIYLWSVGIIVESTKDTITNRSIRHSLSLFFLFMITPLRKTAVRFAEGQRFVNSAYAVVSPLRSTPLPWHSKIMIGFLSRRGETISNNLTLFEIHPRYEPVSLFQKAVFSNGLCLRQSLNFSIATHKLKLNVVSCCPHSRFRATLIPPVAFRPAA